MTATPAADALAGHVRANRLTEDSAVERILTALPPRTQARKWHDLVGVSAIDGGRLRASVEAVAARGLVLSFSHDPYHRIVGGVQNCVRDEERAFVARGWAYLHLCPFHPLPILADPVPSTEFRLLCSLNGQSVGVLSLSSLLDALAPIGLPRLVVLHHLLGHAPERVAELIDAVQPDHTYFWTHDLFAHCSSVHLLRNEVRFCDGPPVGSPACGICHAGPERPDHVARLDAFFERVEPHLLAPSQTILDMWRRIRPLPHSGASVIPPCTFAAAAAVPPASGPLEIGFLGVSFYHKGWDVFESLALWFEGDPRYRFHQLAYRPENVPGLRFRKVEVTREDPEAMVRAVQDARLDVVVNWPRAYESFSFTAAEALAGGAFLLVRRDGGNVAALLQAIAPAQGLALADPVELQALFATGRISELARAAPRRYGSIAPGSGAAALVPAP